MPSWSSQKRRLYPLDHAAEYQQRAVYSARNWAVYFARKYKISCCTVRNAMFNILQKISQSYTFLMS